MVVGLPTPPCVTRVRSASSASANVCGCSAAPSTLWVYADEERPSASTCRERNQGRPGRRRRAPWPRKAERRRPLDPGAAATGSGACGRLGGDERAEAHQLRRGRAERVLELLRPQEVAVDRIIDVDADAAVNVQRGMADAAAA